MIDVEPLIISELERMLPLPDGSRADWKDVLLRAGSADGRRIRARRLAFAAGQGEPHCWRRVLVAIVAVALLAGAGVAIAASFGVFRGIKAAQHPRTKADRLDPAVVASIISHNRQDKRLMHTSRGLLEPGSSRLVRQLPDGARVFAVAATGGELCVVMERMPRLASNMKPGGYTAGCTSPLTQKLPTTIESFRAWKKLGGSHEESPALSWGITLDGVTAISFMAGRHELTVPVKHNVWVYLGRAAVNKSVVVHFQDGRTQTVP